MESKAKITARQYKRVNATVKLENNQLIFFTKPAWVSNFFGVVGEAFASEKERFRLDIVDIVSANLGDSWTGKPVYTLFDADKKKYKIIFRENNQLAEMLNMLLGDRLGAKQ